MKYLKLSLLVAIPLLIIGTIVYVSRVRSVEVLSGEKDCVVLLHGLGRSSSSMGNIAQFLNNDGYQTINIDYPSTKINIEKIVESYVKPAIEEFCPQTKKINFVSHSLGGIVSRYYIWKYPSEKIFKNILIGSPNQGSELADFLSKIWLIRKVMGPVLSELKTDNTGVAKLLPKPDNKTLVIAGDKSINYIFSAIIAGVDDGKVSVESTKIGADEDFYLVHENHTFIMNSKEVKEKIINYLNNK